MNLSKIYSHCKSYVREKKKQKTPNNHDLNEIPSRKRSVTYNTDTELISQLISQENLLELIGKVQKQKQENYSPIQIQELHTLPPLKFQSEQEPNNKISSRYRAKPTQRDFIEYSIPLDSHKKQYFDKFNLYGKFIEPTIQKHFDYKSMKTVESAIAMHNDLENRVARSVTERIDLKKRQIILVQEEQQQEKKVLRQSNFKFHSLTMIEDDHVANLYSKQAKMNKIINKALSIKSQQRDPSNASKSMLSEKVKFQMDLRKQYENALDLAMQGYQVYNEKEDLQRQHSKKNSSRTRILTNQQLRFKNSPHPVHPKKQFYVNKTIDIQHICSSILNE